MKFLNTTNETKEDIETLLKETGFRNIVFHEYKGEICIIVRK